MSFWINDRAGIAYERTEGGLAKWNSKSASFNVLMSAAEREAAGAYSPETRRVSEDEAEAFMLAKDSASAASGPRS